MVIKILNEAKMNPETYKKGLHLLSVLFQVSLTAQSPLLYIMLSEKTTCPEQDRWLSSSEYWRMEDKNL